MRLKMRVFIQLLVVVSSASVFAMEGSDNSYDLSVSPDNPLPPTPPRPQFSSGPSLQYEPPQPQSRNPNYKYGPPPPPPPQSNGQSLMYGPPPPSSSLEYQNPSSYGTAFSLFDDDCGHWKALSVILLVGITLAGVCLVFGLWPLPLSIFDSHDPTSKLTNPAFMSSVYEQIGDISRILTSIKEATDKPKDE